MMPNNHNIQKIFSAPDVKHGLSLFSTEEISAIERLITERDEKLFIKCQIKDKYKVAKPQDTNNSPFCITGSSERYR